MSDCKLTVTLAGLHVPHIRLPADGAAAQVGDQDPPCHQDGAGGDVGGAGGVTGQPRVPDRLRYYGGINFLLCHTNEA